MPTTWLAASKSCSSYKHLFRASGIWPGSSDLYERSQLAASPWSRISFSGPPPDGPHPQNGGPNQAGVPGIHTKGAENSLSAADTGPRPLDPFHWGWERSLPGDDEEEVTRVGVPSCLCRPWMRALHQESRSCSQTNWRGSRTGPSGSGTWKELVSSPKGICTEMEPINSMPRRWSIHLY